MGIRRRTNSTRRRAATGRRAAAEARPSPPHGAINRQQSRTELLARVLPVRGGGEGEGVAWWRRE
jgi:hypothetical protein